MFGRLSESHQPDDATEFHKQPRYRTKYTDEQRKSLEMIFQHSPYPDVQAMETIAINLNLTDERVRIWFKNQRAKHRKQTIKDPVSFPMDAWRAHSKRLLTSTRMPVPQGSKLVSAPNTDLPRINCLEPVLSTVAAKDSLCLQSVVVNSDKNQNNGPTLIGNLGKFSQESQVTPMSLLKPANCSPALLEDSQNNQVPTDLNFEEFTVAKSLIIPEPLAQALMQNHISIEEIPQKQEYITQEQAFVLDKIFQYTTRNPTEGFMEEISDSVKLSTKFIKNWFTERRSRWKAAYDAVTASGATSLKDSASCQDFSADMAKKIEFINEETHTFNYPTLQINADEEYSVNRSSFNENITLRSTSILPHLSFGQSIKEIWDAKELQISARNTNMVTEDLICIDDDISAIAEEMPQITHLIGCPDPSQCFCHLASLKLIEKNDSVTTERINILKYLIQCSTHQNDDDDVDSSQNDPASSNKIRNRRINYSSEQLSILRFSFQRTPYPDISSRKFLARLLGLSTYNVKIWFKNERMKHKRGSTMSVTSSGHGILPTAVIEAINSSIVQNHGSNSSSITDKNFIHDPLDVSINHLLPTIHGSLVSSDPFMTCTEDPLRLSSRENLNPSTEGSALHGAQGPILVPKLEDSMLLILDENGTQPMNSLTVHSSFHAMSLTSNSASINTVQKKAVEESSEGKLLSVKEECIEEEPESTITDSIHRANIKEELLEEDLPALEDEIKDIVIKLKVDASPISSGFMCQDSSSSNASSHESKTSLEPIGKDVNIKREIFDDISVKEELLKEIVENPNTALPREQEELEVFDGLQNLQLPLFTIQYPRDVANPSSECFVSVIVQPSTQDANIPIVSLSNTIGRSGRKGLKKPLDRPREYICDMQIGVCLAKFKTAKHLQDHRSTHLKRGRKRKTYECFYYSADLDQTCSVTVSKKVTLERHMKEHHIY